MLYSLYHPQPALQTTVCAGKIARCSQPNSNILLFLGIIPATSALNQIPLDEEGPMEGDCANDHPEISTKRRRKLNFMVME